MAAKIIGVKEVLVPARNKRNVAELDEEIISGLKITYVEEMNEVIKCALKKRIKNNKNVEVFLNIYCTQKVGKR